MATSVLMSSSVDGVNMTNQTRGGCSTPVQHARKQAEAFRELPGWSNTLMIDSIRLKVSRIVGLQVID